jgi:tetratricopeptide (TPR) repeat protein
LSLVVALSALTAGPSVHPVPAFAAPATGVDKQIQDVSQNVHDLRVALDESQKTEDRVLTPISFLIGILAAGGVLGIVFGMRDQRRVSQLHELSVGGEISAQRRTEQGYATFFEQSQTTLALVNDTLKLAKDASENAARTMRDKAQERVDQIEERAQRLMFNAFNAREFEAIVKQPERLNELESVAADLRALEAYLSLQDVRIGQYTRFVKAIAKFVNDDTEGALQALQLAVDDGAVGDLQRFIEYWHGYVLTTVGEYDEAIRRFRHDELILREEDDPEYFQLERIICETEFFALAKPKENQAGVLLDTRTPSERFAAVAELLDRLTDLAGRLEAGRDARAKLATTLEIARTRADIFEWVAYDERHLDVPIENLPAEWPKVLSNTPEAAVEFLETPEWAAMTADDDAVRAWALVQAHAICEPHGEGSFDVQFAIAECYFKLQRVQARAAFKRAEEMAHEIEQAHHEKRTIAALRESLLICHSRLLRQPVVDEDGRTETKQARANRVDEEMREIRRAARAARDAVKDLSRQQRVTIFSQIQRRNITQEEFKKEINAIVDQGDLGSEGS